MTSPWYAPQLAISSSLCRYSYPLFVDEAEQLAGKGWEIKLEGGRRRDCGWWGARDSLRINALHGPLSLPGAPWRLSACRPVGRGGAGRASAPDSRGPRGLTRLPRPPAVARIRVGRRFEENSSVIDYGATQLVPLGLLWPGPSKSFSSVATADAPTPTPHFPPSHPRPRSNRCCLRAPQFHTLGVEQ